MFGGWTGAGTIGAGGAGGSAAAAGAPATSRTATATDASAPRQSNMRPRNRCPSMAAPYRRRLAHSAFVTRRGLVLAGGGLAGIAWETGILCGIADEVPQAAQALLDSDVHLGTSAGS